MTDIRYLKKDDESTLKGVVRLFGIYMAQGEVVEDWCNAYVVLLYEDKDVKSEGYNDKRYKSV